MEIKVEFNDRDAKRGLAQLIQAGADLTPLMRRIAGRLADATEQAFDNEAASDGAPWEQRAASTLASKAYRDRQPEKILQFSGHLVRSILADWSATEAIVGTNSIYAATHQFGDSHRNIPARPFLGVGPRDVDVIENEAMRYIAEQWR
jgi:phage virion morphogenesis protein